MAGVDWKCHRSDVKRSPACRGNDCGLPYSGQVIALSFVCDDLRTHDLETCSGTDSDVGSLPDP